MENKANQDRLTDESELNRLIRENEKRFRQIVRYMPVMIWVFDTRGALVFWNNESEKITGYSAAEMVGDSTRLAKICTESEGPECVGIDASEPVGKITSGEMDIICKDQTRKTISWSNVRREFPIPEWYSWILAVDVTERKKAENINRALFQISNAVNQTRNLDELYG